MYAGLRSAPIRIVGDRRKADAVREVYQTWAGLELPELGLVVEGADGPVSPEVARFRTMERVPDNLFFAPDHQGAGAGDKQQTDDQNRVAPARQPFPVAFTHGRVRAGRCRYQTSVTHRIQAVRDSRQDPWYSL